MAEGVHQSTLLYKLADEIGLRDHGTILKDVVDLFSCADSSRYCHFFDAAVRSSANSSASERHIGEDEGPQLRILAMMIVRCHISVGGVYVRARARLCMCI